MTKFDELFWELVESVRYGKMTAYEADREFEKVWGRDAYGRISEYLEDV